MSLSTLSTLLHEGGPIMPLILLAALAGYVLAVERLLVWAVWVLRERPLWRARDAAALEARLAPFAAHPAPPHLAAVLLRALPLRMLPAAQREAALQAALLARVPRVEARISTLGWLGTILPLLGLLGTVSGMITTFQDLAVTTSRQVLSQGLSEALWTTEAGLIAAVPLLAVHHLLSRLRSRWFTHLERNLALLFAAAATPGDAPGTAGSAAAGAPRPPAPEDTP